MNLVQYTKIGDGSPMASRRVAELREIFGRHGLSDEAVGRAHRILLRAVRPALDLVYIDAISDRPWPVEVGGERNALRALGLEQRETERGDSQMAIRLDPRSDEQFGIALALARYSIGVEGYSLGKLVFGAHDTGRGLWADLSPDQYRALEELVGRGESVDSLFEERVPKDWWRWPWFRRSRTPEA
jgi:hypothetical protein